MSQKPFRRGGFTLIEMSIVLIIIGLIVGGVLVGRSLIRQAELRNLIKAIESYKTAVFTFRDKYNCLPGDCSNASSLLGAGTGDGNGNGTISYLERYYFWNDFGLAGLIPQLPGANSNGNPNAFTGSNIPGTASLSYSVFCTSGIDDWANLNGATKLYGKDNCFLLVTNPNTNWSGYPGLSGPFTSSEALGLDTKFDDGLPYSGNIVAGRGDAGAFPYTQHGCITVYDERAAGTSNYYTLDYFTCSLFFVAGFAN